MAKARTKKKTTEEALPPDVIDPKLVHQLFGLPGPYDDRELPIPTKGFTTFHDCGMSIVEMKRRKPELFSWCEWLEGQGFAKVTDSWRWRQISLEPFDLGKTFTEAPDLPLARELVSFLILTVLATGVRLEIPRLRCRDVLPSGRRAVVGPWREAGLEIANVSDRWSSSDMGCVSLYTPVMKPRKK